MTAPYATPVSSRDLEGLPYQELSPRQVKELAALLALLEQMSTSYPGRFASLFRAMYGAMLSVVSHTQTDAVAVVDGEVTAPMEALPAHAVLDGELLDYRLPCPDWPFPALHLITRDVTPKR